MIRTTGVGNDDSVRNDANSLVEVGGAGLNSGPELHCSTQDFRPYHKPATDGEPDFIFDGKLLSRSHIDRIIHHMYEPVLVAGSVVEEPNVIRAFDSIDAFEAFAEKSKYASYFQEISNVIRSERARADRDYRRAVRLRAAKNAGDLALSSEYDSALTSDHNFKSFDYSDPSDSWTAMKTLVPPVRKSPEAGITLFERERFRGASFMAGPCSIYDLNDVQFSMARSIKMRGVCLLTDLPRFGGLRFYFAGQPSIEVANLKRWGFVKGVASLIVL
jgi:hypothetical protein